MPIAGQSFFEGVTLAEMGLSVGSTFEWTWGSGGNADKAVLQIISSVPEPGSIALLSAVAVALVTVAVRRRRATA